LKSSWKFARKEGRQSSRCKGWGGSIADLKDQVVVEEESVGLGLNRALVSFFLFFLVVMEFELRALLLPGRHFLALSLFFLYFQILCLGGSGLPSSYLCFLCGWDNRQERHAHLFTG
jgi:hypothetical protein